YNHINHFAFAAEALCKSLFFGGVTRRFPQLKFAFLEGGSAWGASLYVDIIWHWETRNKQHLLTNNNPAILDKEALVELYTRYGGELVDGRLDKIGDDLGFHHQLLAPEDPGELDEFELAGIEKPEDVRDRFLNHF
ncbi:MAG: amidohydrolase family protein, partial [Nostoc sp.]